MASFNLIPRILLPPQKKTCLYLLVITLIALLIRVVKQPTVPYGFHRDEAGIAYSAYSILQTGRDEWGRLLPLHFKALGDYPPGIYNYLTAGFTAVFGPGPLAERMPAVVFGTLLVPLVYLFLKQVFTRPQLGLITAGLVALSPWFIVQSRSGGEPILALFFSILGLLAYYKFLKSKKWPFLFALAISYFLALYTYNAVRPVLPVVHLLLSWYHWPLIKTNKNKFTTLALASLILIVSVATVFLSDHSAMRFNSLSIWNQIEKQSFEAMYNREGHHHLPVILSRLFHNKYLSLVKTVIGHISQHFTFGFLFNDAGRPLRYLVPKVGQLHLFVLPFLILGLLAQGKLRQKDRLFWGLLSLIAVVPAAVTSEDLPHVKRTMYLFLPLLVFVANGFLISWDWLKSQAKLVKFSIFILLGCGYGYSFSFFTNQYLIHTKYETAVNRSYGYLQAFKSLKRLEPNYETVNIYENNDTPHVYYLLVNQYDPRAYQQQSQQNHANLFTDDKQTWQIVDYRFIPGSCPFTEDLHPDQLYLSKVWCRDELKQKINILDVIKLPEGEAKLIIFESALP